MGVKIKMDMSFEKIMHFMKPGTSYDVFVSN
jgi:hypothetical protein